MIDTVIRSSNSEKPYRLFFLTHPIGRYLRRHGLTRNRLESIRPTVEITSKPVSLLGIPDQDKA
jgi:hypothetical protein